MKVGLLIRSIVVVAAILVFSVYAYNRVDESLQDGIRIENKELMDINLKLGQERKVRQFALSAFINEGNADTALKLTSAAYKGQYSEVYVANILGIERREDTNAVSNQQK